MAAPNDEVNDSELRRRLSEFGQDVGPVTDATRSLLLRKLRRLEKERKGKQVVEEKSPPPRRASSHRRSSPSRGQSPSRRLIGFSSDEEDAPPSGSKGFKSLSKIRGRLSEGAARDRESTGLRRKSSAALSSKRKSLPSFVSSVDEKTVDSTDRNKEEDFSDLDGQAYSRSSNRTPHSKFLIRPFRPAKHDGEERERSIESSGSFLAYHKEISDSEPPLIKQERQFGARKVKDSFWPFKISLLISTVCIILFCVAFKRYSSEDIISEHLVKLPICDNGSVASRELKPPDCADLDHVASRYAAMFFQNLSTRAGLFDCNDPSVKSRDVSLEFLKRQIEKDNLSRPYENILTRTMEFLINNSDWKIRLFDKKNEETTNYTDAVLIDTLVSAKPLFCCIREALSRLVYFLLVVGIVTGGLLFGYFVVRQRWRREEEETRQMYSFVEKIIDILREHHEESKTDKNLLPYLPIPHVRDMLIAPAERQNLAKTWSRAVRFLSANESRIRVESQRIAGEDFEVWRWIHIAPPKQHSHKMSLSGTKHGKFWQGQAFENFQSAVNPPVISPTPCLKIRNMFDPDIETEDGWHVMIQDAILEKCIENGASVVHIAVDKSSSEGCVYVKCDSHHSAGLAFRSLHGCWFDGRLVAVKYLTLKRYHQRYPVALEATVHLTPSGSSPSSLVTFDPDEGEDDDDVNDSDAEVA